MEAGKYELTISNDGSYGLFAQDHFIGYANVSNTSLGTLQYGSVNLIYLVPEARKTKAFLIFVNALRHVIAKPILVDGSVFKDGAEALKAMAKRHLFRELIGSVDNLLASMFLASRRRHLLSVSRLLASIQKRSTPELINQNKR